MNSDDIQDIITLIIAFIWLVISIVIISFVAKYRELEFNRLWRLRVFLVVLLILHALLSALSNLKWFPRQFHSLEGKCISCCVSNFLHQMFLYPFFIAIITILLKSSTKFSLIQEQRPNRQIVCKSILLFLIPTILGIANIVLVIFETDILCFEPFDIDSQACVAPSNYEFITIIYTVILIIFLSVSFKRRLSESGINLHHQNRLRKLPFLYIPFIVVFGATIAEPFVSKDIQIFFRYFDFVLTDVFMFVLIVILVIKPTKESAQNPLERGHITVRHNQIEAIPGLYDNEGNELDDFDETMSTDEMPNDAQSIKDDKQSPSQSKNGIFDEEKGEESPEVILEPPKGDDQDDKTLDPKLASQLKNLDAIFDDSDDMEFGDMKPTNANKPTIQLQPNQDNQNNKFKDLDAIFSDDDDDGGLGPNIQNINQNVTTVQPTPSPGLIQLPTDQKGAKTFKDLDAIFSDDDDENEVKPAPTANKPVTPALTPLPADQKGAKTFKDLDAIFSDDDDDNEVKPAPTVNKPVTPALTPLPADQKGAKAFKDLDAIFSDDESNNGAPQQPQPAVLQLPTNAGTVKRFQDVDAILQSDDEDDIKPEPIKPAPLQIQPQQPTTIKKFQDIDAILGSDDEDEPKPEEIKKPVVQPAQPGQLQIQPVAPSKPTPADIQDKFKDLDNVFSDDDDDM